MTNPPPRDLDDTQRIGVFAPATVANVGPGFDCFGFALERPGDVVRVSGDDAPGVRIAGIEGDDGDLPLDPDRNTAAVAAAHVLAARSDHWPSRGLAINIEKGMPSGSGLGSSAATAVAAAMAAMHFLEEFAGAPFDRSLVFEAALAGEAVASGAPHADNVAPSLVGGFTIARAGCPPTVARFEPALACWAAVVTPALSVSTREARAALPKTVPLADAVTNWSNAAGLVAGLLTGDAALVRRSLVDVVVEPSRATLIPGFAEVRRAALDTDALGCGISGSGPTVFALAGDARTAAAVAEVMSERFRAEGLASTVVVSRMGADGARRV